MRISQQATGHPRRRRTKSDHVSGSVPQLDTDALYPRCKPRVIRLKITIDLDASTFDAADLMLKHNIRRLPVVKDGALVGIITRKDLLNA